MSSAITGGLLTLLLCRSCFAWLPTSNLLHRHLDIASPRQGLILPGEEGYDLLVPGGAQELEDEEDAEEAKTVVELALEERVKEMNDRMAGSVFAKDRPAFGICASTSYPNEFVMGSELPQNDDAAAEWLTQCKQAGVSRVLALFNDCIDEEEAADACTARLLKAGFDEEKIGLIFLSLEGALPAALGIIAEAKKGKCGGSGDAQENELNLELGLSGLASSGESELLIDVGDANGLLLDTSSTVGLSSGGGGSGGTAGKENIVVACTTGAALTSLVLGAHVMQEYGVNPEEAASLLRARVKFSGVVERVPDIETLAAFVEHGCTGRELTDKSLAEFEALELREQDDGVTGAAYVPVTEAGRRELDQQQKGVAGEEEEPAGPTTTQSGLIL